MRLFVPGSSDYPEFVDGRYQDGHLTTKEWLGLRKLHLILAPA